MCFPMCKLRTYLRIFKSDGWMYTCPLYASKSLPDECLQMAHPRLHMEIVVLRHSFYRYGQPAHSASKWQWLKIELCPAQPHHYSRWDVPSPQAEEAVWNPCQGLVKGKGHLWGNPEIPSNQISSRNDSRKTFSPFFLITTSVLWKEAGLWMGSH